jgi:GNAT superfamily N-acetyltransferase
MPTYFATPDGDPPTTLGVQVLGSAVAAELVLRDMPGRTVVCARPLGEQLAGRGALVRRRFRRMARSLATDPPPASWAQAALGPGRRAVGHSRSAVDVFPAWRAAFDVEGHPDRFTGSDDDALTERLAPLLDGREGAVLPWSRLVVDRSDRVIAGVIALDAARSASMPWIAEVFRRPGSEYAGVGTALLQRVLATAAAAGVPEVGLSVTDGNQAWRVYHGLGFRTTASLVTLTVPERTPGPALGAVSE